MAVGPLVGYSTYRAGYWGGNTRGEIFDIGSILVGCGGCHVEGRS